MHVLISGGTGLVGSVLTNKLVQKGHTVTILTRNLSNKQNNDSVRYIQWLDGSRPEEQLSDVDAVVNFAGASISKPWTRSHKEAILESRIETTRECVRLVHSLKKTPSVFFSTSAVGYYGISETDEFTEESAPVNEPFLQQVSERWEQEAREAGDDVRLIIGRLGLVLDRHEGAFPKMMLPYRLGIGGPIGSGNQWYSWIHLDDAAEAVLFSIENEQCEGVMNLTAPEPMRMKEFGKTIGETIKRPHWLPVPGFALRLMLGEMTDLILKGQKVLPERTESFGYHYRYPTLKTALQDIFK